MSKIPASWKLKTRKRSDGKTDVIGKDDSGRDYKVRTCQGEVSEADIKAIAETDRERTDARTFVKGLTDAGRAFRENQERQLGEGFAEDAARLVRECTEGGHAAGPGQIEISLSLGSTAKYRAGWEKAFGGS